MFHPTRGGTRGGRDQFSWEDVKTDKDRENYLGNSLMAPVGRWQKGKLKNKVVTIHKSILTLS
ncbi:kinase phosphorylation protein-domain-containing protein [Chlamydoabsidia padenii]|nr:kinase phosphorylation protein-domain-containing protein [Chlamydoabsidia padenii]